MRRMENLPGDGSKCGTARSGRLLEVAASEIKESVERGRKATDCVAGAGASGATAALSSCVGQHMQLMPVLCMGQFDSMPRQQAGDAIERAVSRRADAGSTDQSTATSSINHAPFLLIDRIIYLSLVASYF